MNNDNFLDRFSYIPATPRIERISSAARNRRGENYVEEDSSHPSEDYDSIFDYEEEFFSTPAARETVQSDLDSFEQPEKIEHKIVENKPTFIVMEKITPQSLEANNRIEQVDEITKPTPVFEFVRCSFVKEDGVQCKKQAKKDHEYCGVHRKYIERNSG